METERIGSRQGQNTGKWQELLSNPGPVVLPWQRGWNRLGRRAERRVGRGGV